MIWADQAAPLLDQTSWHKNPVPVFSSAWSGSTGVYGAGHNSFFDHETARKTGSCIMRIRNPARAVVRTGIRELSRSSGRKTVCLIFGKPVSAGVPLPIPSEKERAVAAH